MVRSAILKAHLLRHWFLRLAFATALPMSMHAGPAVPLPDVEWPMYAGDEAGSHYSPLTDIDRGNVERLTPVWIYHTGALRPPGALNEKAAFESTPLMVEGTLILTTPFDRVIALDPASGKEKWAYDPAIDRGRRFATVTSRGVAFLRGQGRRPCASRIFLGTIDGRLIALDSRSGRLCSAFGRGGTIDLAAGAAGPDRDQYEVTSPPIVIGKLVVVGSSIGDDTALDTGRGVVRAFDAITGKLRWSFDPLLPRKGMVSGAANAWAVMAADSARGLLFIPTGSASPDYYGGSRPGDNRYADSVVALRAATGKVLWSFQAVHHDLWDFDVASQPNLIEVLRDGKRIPAVAVTTKMGHLFFLDRLTGAPLLPVTERAVPRSDVPGEAASPTQPFPSNPTLSPPGLTADDAWGITDRERESCRARIASLRYEGIFTPPSVGGTLVFPGNQGGVAWGGASYDRRRRLLVVNENRLALAVRLVPRDAGASGTATSAKAYAEHYPQTGAPYSVERDELLSPLGFPCNPPPWGTLAAVDVDTGAIRWQVPLGAYRFSALRSETVPGAPSLGGSLITAGGLVFIAATLNDDSLKAIDIDSGREVWRAPLPAGGQATPMTYRVSGVQYVVVCAGGHGSRSRGDAVVAFAVGGP